MEKGYLQDYSDYASHSGWGSWAFRRFVQKPVNAAASSLRNHIFGEEENEFESKNDNRPFINTGLLVSIGEEIVARHMKAVVYVNTENIVSFSEFKNLLKTSKGDSLCLKKSDLELVIEQLKRDRKIAVYNPSSTGRLDDVYIKFVSEGNTNSKQARFTDIDCGILVVKKAILKLRERIQTLLSRKNPSLKRIIKKEYMCLKNLEDIILQVNNSESNGDILKAYASGSVALKGVLDFHNLSLEKVEDVMEDMQSALEEAQDVEQAIANGSALRETEEDDELLKELEQLVEEDGQHAVAKEKDRAHRGGDENELIVALEKLSVASHELETTDSASASVNGTKKQIASEAT